MKCTLLNLKRKHFQTTYWLIDKHITVLNLNYLKRACLFVMKYLIAQSLRIHEQ